MTGFDSSLERCPKCNSIYSHGKERVYRFNLVYFLFFSLVLIVALPVSMLIILQAVKSIVRAIPHILSISIGSISTGSIFIFLIWGLYFYTIFWSYLDANKRGKPGCLVAFLVAAMPIMGSIMWLIFRP